MENSFVHSTKYLLVPVPWLRRVVPGEYITNYADALNMLIVNILCIRCPCSTTLVFCIISDVLPDDDPFSVETCRSN